MAKIRQQLMIDEDIFFTLIELGKKYNVTNMSQCINKCLREAFRYRDTLDKKEQTIVKLQNVITELGTRAEDYRNQLKNKEENKK